MMGAGTPVGPAGIPLGATEMTTPVVFLYLDRLTARWRVYAPRGNAAPPAVSERQAAE